MQRHALAFGERPQLIEVFSRSGRVQQRSPEMLSVGDVDPQSRRIDSRGRVFLFGPFGDEREIGHQIVSRAGSRRRR